MKKSFRTGLFVFSLLPVAAHFASGHQPAPLTEQEKQHMSELTRNLKPRCVGRYVIDMPADALVSSGAKIDDVTIDPVAMSRNAYLREVSAHQAELRGTKSRDQYPFLYANEAVSGMDAHYFISRGSTGYGPGFRLIEAYRWDHGYRFKFKVEGSDFLHPDQTYRPSVQQLSVKNDVPEKTRLVLDMVKRIRGRADDDIPAQPGICIQGGFLPGKAGDREDIVVQFVPASNRDVSFDFESDSSIRESDTLLQRGEQINAGLKTMKGGRTIRKGTVTLPGINAEEWLMAVETDQGVPGSMFALEANATTGGASSPVLTFVFSTGSPNAYMQDRIKAASLSEGEAVALWDAISRTLRPRPGASQRQKPDS